MKFGKLERWILIHGYLKAKKKEMPRDWKKLDGQRKRIEDELVKKDIYYFKFLQKEEIILNYFHINASNHEYKDKMITVTEALRLLEEKGYIVRYNIEDWGILLTNKGELEAEKLLDTM